MKLRRLSEILCTGLVFFSVLFFYPLESWGQKSERAILAFGSSGGNLTAFWVAREAGLYRQQGLDVDVVFLRGSTTAINALVAAEAHFAALGASSSVLARIGGIDTVLIATAAPGLSFYLVTKKESTGAATLKGRKLAISRPVTDSDLAARFAVQKLGLSEREVSFITIGSDTERIAALQQGVVDATVLTPSAYVAAKKPGDGEPFHQGLRRGNPLCQEPPGIHVKGVEEVHADRRPRCSQCQLRLLRRARDSQSPLCERGRASNGSRLYQGAKPAGGERQSPGFHG